MEIQEKAIILSVKRVDFTASDTKQQVVGTSVQYGVEVSGDEHKGYAISKTFFRNDLNIFNALVPNKKMTAVFELTSMASKPKFLRFEA